MGVTVGFKLVTSVSLVAVVAGSESDCGSAVGRCSSDLPLPS